jgi:hypothetical protein
VFLIMTATSKREYLGKIRERYRRAGKRYKTRILDEFCAVCAYERKWAIKLFGASEEAAAEPARPGAHLW